MKFESYYRDLHLIFVELNDIWYYQNTSYFIKYNKLLKSNPVPNDHILGELMSNFFKNIAHADNNVMTTEELYQKMNNERKKTIVIRTRNEDTFKFRRNTDFYVSYKRIDWRHVTKIPTFLQYCMYLGECKLTPGETSHIRATYIVFNLKHLYKHKSSIQLLGYWTRHNVISREMYGECKFDESHFMLNDDFNSETKNVFNSTKNISSKEEKVIIHNIGNYDKILLMLKK